MAASNIMEETVPALAAATSGLSLTDATTFDGIPTSILVDTIASLSKMVDSLEELPNDPPSLYIDLEGVNLSRYGTISILQLHVLPSKETYLLDVHTLKDRCFSETNRNGHSFRDILESDAIPKVFFDVRNDSDALYHHFQIKLSGIQDLQLMELATRTFSRKVVNGLSRCIERDALLSYEERLAWKMVKDKGVRLFAPEHGGSYQVFNERPLSSDMVNYCVQDVKFLPLLWTRYKSKLTSTWWQKVQDASKERVTLSQSSAFIGKGKHMALSPPGWTSIHGW
ncbi:3'-5' exonuclease [Colletotrichum salicis]|uniref:3'-5' exonuclease n=1 Tax=Colletotrichum salicis TaxID=1209931 RepID=A0A135RNR7_9PEZI|nr:3'-5' exonuclease [Colletotrichum salicis]